MDDKPPIQRAEQQKPGLVPPANAARRSNGLLFARVVLTIGVVLGFAACDAAIAPLMQVFRPSDFVALFIYAIMGVIATQLGVLATYAALGPGIFWQRRLGELAVGLLWLLAFSIGLLVAPWFKGDASRERSEVWMVLSVPLVYVLIPFTLWTMRVLFRLRIEADDAPPASRQAPQFTIAELMVMTAIIAVTLGGARATSLLGAKAGFGSFWMALAATTAAAWGINLVSMLPATVLLLAPRRPWWGLAGLVVYSLVAYGVTAAVIYFFVNRSLTDALYPLAPVWAGFSLGIIAPLLWARAVRYRLRWGRPPVSDAAEA